MEEEGDNELQIHESEFLSPLGELAIELNEMSEELQMAGFTESMVAQIMANIISDAMANRPDYEEENDDEEGPGTIRFFFELNDDDEDEDNLDDGGDS